MKETKENELLSSTPYDDVFRTLINDCKELIIPVINEVFGEHYTGEERIEFTPNEHFLNAQGGKEDKRVTDSSFRIIGEEQTKNYHLECQSTPDDSMLIRFFEYDTQIALDQGKINNYVLTVEFPHSAVLFLRSDKNTPEQMRIEMKTPGGSVGYDIPVMKSQEYSLTEIFEKKLLFLIPFYIFSHESNFSVYNEEKDGLDELTWDYLLIQSKLEDLSRNGEITEYMKCMLYDMSSKVVENIARKYDNVREGVQEIMRGRVLDYPAKDILNQGKREAALDFARNLFAKGMNIDFVKSCSDVLSEEELTEVYAQVNGERLQLWGAEKPEMQEKPEKKTAQRKVVPRGPKL